MLWIGLSIYALRGISVTPGQEPAKPTIDLYVNFEFDSARLQTDALLTLQELATALRDSRLDGYRFEIAGHTDSVGTAEYNQKLSEQRARTVADWLIAAAQIAPDRLVSAGYGFSRPLDPVHPADGVNRRVQVTNIGQ